MESVVPGIGRSTGRQYQLERRKAAELMSGVDLNSLDFARPDNWWDLPKGEWETSKDVEIAGKPYTLTGFHRRATSSMSVTDEYWFDIKNSEDSSLIEGSVYNVQPLDGSDANIEALIDRRERLQIAEGKEPELPRGSGLSRF